ncbi:hypothetical protein NM208_g3209 [Fusarium decemcellulare]|uniref:Uncharacterized protein n=2 Tax=Fusarium decemcellulare TaxID=57161 RepID=A0ACC1SM71_9HYPO|nr:hypothetical protein NM208_g4044 [Fusarium decemcellulare]KAJ3544161.1 hypothetical protein NM208_g3209 [Fusarium decemcellulare]
MPPSKDEGGVSPSFDLNTEIPNPDTTGTIRKDTPGSVSFLDNLDVSMFDVSSIDFSEVLDAPWLNVHAPMDDMVPVGDNSHWPSGIFIGETSEHDPHVESGLSQEELSALLLPFPSPAESGVATLEAPEPEPMDLNSASNVPLLPDESTVGEAQPMINQQDVLGGFEITLHQHLGLQFSEAREIADGGAELLGSRHHDVPSGPSSFRGPYDGTHNVPATSTTVHGVSSMQALEVLGTGHSATNSYPPPIFPQQRPLVPRKRGGRHGRLTEDQRKRQRTARLTGVCIRCKYLNKSCYGGFPCEACQTVRKPRLFRGPCTKAQFLEIIQAGSFFLRMSVYEDMILDRLDERTVSNMMDISLIKHCFFGPLVVKVLGQECRVCFQLGANFLHLLGFSGPADQFQKPDSSIATQLFRALVKLAPQGNLIEFPYEFKGSQRVHWTLVASSFCSGKRLFLSQSNEAGDDVNAVPLCFDDSLKDDAKELEKTLIWLSCRYGELCLFHHIQETCNQLAQKATPDVNLVYCIFIILRVSIANDKLENSLRTCDDPHRLNMAKEYFDRRKRVRMALWAYASIVISNVPSWTNFWEDLPWSVDIFREPKVLKRFAESLDNFDDEAYEACKSVFNSKKAIFQRLSFADELHSHENYAEDQDFIENFWARILTNTPDGVEQLRYVLSGNSSGSADEVTQYELDEAERVFLPKTEKDRKVAIRRVFGKLISLWEIPMSSGETINPATFQWLVSAIKLFQLRLSLGVLQIQGASAIAQDHEHLLIPSGDELRECMHTSECIKASKRWQELTHIFGDGILLSGNRNRDSHCFLDIPTLVEHGDDAAFSNLKMLLHLKGSWLKSMCAKLSGLVRALRKLPCPGKDLRRVREFYMQVHNATVEAFGMDPLPDAHNSSHKTELSVFMLIAIEGFMPARWKVSKRHKITWDIFMDVVHQIKVETLENKFTFVRESHVQMITRALELVKKRFMARYVDTLRGNGMDLEDAAVDMAERMSLLASGFIAFMGRKRFSSERLPELPEDLIPTELFGFIFAD